MATYYCDMKVGNKNTGASASAHFDYINREGNYNTRDEDLVATGSGNLPDFADGDAKKFFEACDKKDIRTHRTITFTLPKELPREAQLEIVEEYRKVVAPNLPYSYAIHEVDSAIYGEKNPHCHLMFSERIVDERVQHLCEEDFFAKKGKTIHGYEYGGSVKTRMYAGKSKTKQIYEIRQALADITNRKYEEHGFDIRISADTLAMQEKSVQKSGDVEVNLPKQPTFPRLSREMFHQYKNVIKYSILQMKDVKEMEIPEPVKERILYEQERILTKELKENLMEYKESVLNNTEAMKYAVDTLVRERQIVQDVFYSPFNRKDYFAYSVEDIEAKNSTQTEASYTSLALKEDIDNAEIKYLQGEKELHKMLKDVKIALRKIDDEINYLASIDDKKLEIMILDEESNGKYSYTLQKINRKEILATHYEEVNKEYEAMTNRKELEELYRDKEKLEVDIFAQKEELLEKIEERIEILKSSKENLEELLRKAINVSNYEELELVHQEEIKEQIVEKKHERLSEKIDEAANKKVEEIEENHKDLTSDEKLKLKIRDRLLNEATNGEYGKLKEKLRSKESLIEYHKNKTKDMEQMYQVKYEAEYLRNQMRNIEVEYVTPELKEKVETEFNKLKEKQKGAYTKDKKKLQKIAHSKRVKPTTKNKATKVLTAISKLANGVSNMPTAGNRPATVRGQRGLHADRIHVEDDVIR